MSLTPADTPVLQRVFIGIGCDSRSQEQIGQLMGPLKKDFPQIRWIPKRNRHLTLAFLGDISTAVLESLMDDFVDAYQQETHFHYMLTRLCRFPNPTGSIVALIGNPDEPLFRIYQDTLALLRTHHLEPAWDEFRPHITLGRIRRPKAVATDIDQQVNIGLSVTNVTIYQSTLTASGSVYTPLQELQLG